MGSKNSDHVIQIWEVKKDRLELMQQKISATPRILSKSAGCSSCCIFRVPQRLVDINGNAYQPQVVSIGPYHHGARHLEMFEEQKWRFLGSLLKRTESIGLKLEDYLKAVQEMEIKARECYSENIHVGSDELVEMLVLDGCFVIELFRKFGGLVEFDTDDPILSMSWVYPFFLRDLITLENQIPFFILQRLFQLTTLPGEESGPTLVTLALKFFNNSFQRPEDVISKLSNLEGRHLLDLLRSSYIPPGLEERRAKVFQNTRVILDLSRLRFAGFKIKPGKDESFLAIKFERGVIEMPPITMDEIMSSFLINCVAYEQCHRGYSKHMTTYATLLDSLIKTTKDVEYLCDYNIFGNYFGSEGEVKKFINNLGKEVTFDIDECYLSGLLNEVHEYYMYSWRVQWGAFKSIYIRYFDAPWSLISALAAFVLLILALLQTMYTIIAYVHPPS